MKKIILAIFLFALTGTSFAQTGNLFFFSENGETFTVMINGLRKNDLPQKQVRVTGLIAAPYLVKILLADSSTGVLNGKIYVTENSEKIFAILPKRKSGVENENKPLGNEVVNTQEATANKDQLDTTNAKFMLKALGENAIGNSNEAGTIQPSMGFSKNTPSSQFASPPQSVIEPESPNPCSYPFNDGSFAAALKHFEAANQNDSQLSAAMKLVSNNCLSCNQIRQLVKIFSIEENRMQLAKYAYDFAFDKQNYDKVVNSFTSAAAIEELNKYIETRK